MLRLLLWAGPEEVEGGGAEPCEIRGAVCRSITQTTTERETAADKTKQKQNKKQTKTKTTSTSDWPSVVSQSGQFLTLMPRRDARDSLRGRHRAIIVKIRTRVNTKGRPLHYPSPCLRLSWPISSSSFRRVGRRSFFFCYCWLFFVGLLGFFVFLPIFTICHWRPIPVYRMVGLGNPVASQNQCPELSHGPLDDRAFRLSQIVDLKPFGLKKKSSQFRPKLPSSLSLSQISVPNYRIGHQTIERFDSSQCPKLSISSRLVSFKNCPNSVPNYHLIFHCPKISVPHCPISYQTIEQFHTSVPNFRSQTV